MINYGLSIMNVHKPSRLVLPHTDAHYMSLYEDAGGSIQPAEPLRRSHKHGTGAHLLNMESDDEDTVTDHVGLSSPTALKPPGDKTTEGRGKLQISQVKCMTREYC